MATNEQQFPGRRLQVTKASVASGDPVMVGALTGVAQGASFTDANATANQVIIARDGVYNLSVKGVITGPANQAVAVGDAIYYTEAHTPKLDKDATAGILFGYAMGAVTSGSTATIAVALK